VYFDGFKVPPPRLIKSEIKQENPSLVLPPGTVVDLTSVVVPPETGNVGVVTLSPTASLDASSGGKFPAQFLVPSKPVHLRQLDESTISDDRSSQSEDDLLGCSAEIRWTEEGGELNPEIGAEIKPDPYDFMTPAPVIMDGKDRSGKKRKPSFPRKQFRETVGTQIFKDLMSEQFSYDEIIAKYSTMYPEYAAKFTPSFCSKVRCGRIMNVEASKAKGVAKQKSRVKRVSKLSHRKTWRKMTPELYQEIAVWEKSQNRPVKQVEFEQIFNVNRSTYYRWKKSQSKPSSTQTKTFGN